MENEPKVEGSTCGTSALSAGLGVADPSCFNCDALGGGLYRVHEGPTQWFVGHADGGGQYACADCKDLLFDALPIATPNPTDGGADDPPHTPQQQLHEAWQIAKDHGLLVIDVKAAPGKTEHVVYRLVPNG